MGTDIHRGDIWMVNLGNGEGSEQRGVKPCLVIQNNMGNRFSPTTVIIPITSKDKGFHKTHVLIENVLNLPSYVLCEQIRVIAKSRMSHRIAHLSKKHMDVIDAVTRMQLGMEED